MSAESGAPDAHAVGARAKLPAPLRLLAFFVATFLALIVFGRLVALVARPGLIAPGNPDLEYQFWFSVVASAALVAAHALFVRRLDREPWDVVYLDRRAARPPLLGGSALLGALAIALPTLLLLGAHQFRLGRAPDGSWLGESLWLLLFLAPAALWEELLFRGYFFSVLRARLGTGVAVGVTSVIFGLIHWSNPGHDVLPILLVVFAGVFLAGVMLATRSLYAAWMAHLAWNWMMAAVLHTPVSGGGLPMSDYQMVETGPDWVTGGPWGPEGGVGAGLGMLAALYLLGRRAPRWWRTDRAGAVPDDTAHNDDAAALASREPV